VGEAITLFRAFHDVEMTDGQQLILTILMLEYCSTAYKKGVEHGKTISKST
jgi:hypothetical protein